MKPGNRAGTESPRRGLQLTGAGVKQQGPRVKGWNPNTAHQAQLSPGLPSILLWLRALQDGEEKSSQSRGVGGGIVCAQIQKERTAEGRK